MPKEQRAVRFDADVMAEIERIAKDEGRTVTNAIRRLVDEAIARRAEIRQMVREDAGDE